MNEQPTPKRYATDAQFVKLLSRMEELVNADPDERCTPIWKVQLLPLIYEAHRLAERLSEDFEWWRGYFEEAPLQDYLACVRAIERVQMKMWWTLRSLLYTAKYGGAQPEPREEEVEEIRLFTPEEKSVSPLWSKPLQTMGQAFYPAHEEWNEHEGLDRHSIANLASRLPDEGEPQSAHYLTDLCRAVSGLTDLRIYQDLMRTLELLRTLFMQQADLIYGIRTGDRTMVPDTPSFDIDEGLPFDSPFFDYHDERSLHRRELIHDLQHRLLDDWRLQQGIVGRPLSGTERIRFLTERRQEVKRQMQEQYPRLWTLRAHCGGCDAGRTPAPIGGIFCVRGAIDRTCFHLQLELLLQDELLMDPPATQVAKSPEEQAIDAFVEKLTRLVTTCHDRWQGQPVSLGAHKGEATVEIRKDDLLSHLHRQLADSTRPLLKHCYPVNGQSNKKFCDYVARLYQEGYFGQLPQKELADVLAPILGMKNTGVRNYLSKKKRS